MKKQSERASTSEDSVDNLVISQAENDSAWELPKQISRSKATSLSISGSLAARAAFLARLHHESGVDQWVERVVRERVELEESAFNEVKRKLAS